MHWRKRSGRLLEAVPTLSPCAEAGATHLAERTLGLRVHVDGAGGTNGRNAWRLAELHATRALGG